MTDKILEEPLNPDGVAFEIPFTRKALRASEGFLGGTNSKLKTRRGAQILCGPRVLPISPHPRRRRARQHLPPKAPGRAGRPGAGRRPPGGMLRFGARAHKDWRRGFQPRPFPTAPLGKDTCVQFWGNQISNLKQMEQFVCRL